MRDGFLRRKRLRRYMILPDNHTSHAYAAVAIHAPVRVTLPVSIFTQLDVLYASVCTHARSFLWETEHQMMIGALQAYAYQATLKGLLLPSDIHAHLNEAYTSTEGEDVYETPSLSEDIFIQDMLSKLETRLHDFFSPTPLKSDVLLEAFIDTQGAYHFTLNAILTYQPPSPDSEVYSVIPLVNPLLLQEEYGLCNILLEHERLILRRHTGWEIRISYEDREYILIGRDGEQMETNAYTSMGDERSNDADERVLLFTLEDATPAPADPAGLAARLLKRMEHGFSFTHIRS